jgi:TRAP-type C4-dicarboxylate transport system substrate-binding protein
MSEKRWGVIIIGSVLLTFITLMVTGTSASAVIKLDLHHFGSPGEAHVVTFNKWGKELESKSSGKIKVTVTCGAALGKGTEYFDFVRTGIADIASVAFPYTPGRFPISEVFGLPINAPSAEIASKAFWQLYKKGLTSSFGRRIRLQRWQI